MQQRKRLNYKLPLEYPVDKALAIYKNRLIVFSGVALFFAIFLLVIVLAPITLGDYPELITRSSGKTSVDSGKEISFLIEGLGLMAIILLQIRLIPALLSIYLRRHNSRKK
jgi:hypothetical protein